MSFKKTKTQKTSLLSGTLSNVFKQGNPWQIPFRTTHWEKACFSWRKKLPPTIPQRIPQAAVFCFFWVGWQLRSRFDLCYHSSQLDFITIITSQLYLWIHFGFKTFSTMSKIFSWSGWHIQKMSLTQRFKMCLLRRVFPRGTAFPWQNVCLFPPHCLFPWSEKRRESKDSKWRAEGVPGKFPGINHWQNIASKTDRSYEE